MDIQSLDLTVQTLVDGGYLTWAYGGMGSKSWPSVRHKYSRRGKALICMDSTESARKDFYPAYKSHRKERRAEREHIFLKVKAFQEYVREDPSLAKVEVSGLEADDLIAILYPGLQVIGGDKDLLQLPGINLSRITEEPLSVGTFIKRQAKKVQAASLYQPAEILLLLTLLGDKSDDIPRVVPPGALDVVVSLMQMENPWIAARELFGEQLLTNLYLAILPGPWCYDPLPTPEQLFQHVSKKTLSELVLRYDLSQLKEKLNGRP